MGTRVTPIVATQETERDEIVRELREEMRIEMAAAKKALRDECGRWRDEGKAPVQLCVAEPSGVRLLLNRGQTHCLVLLGIMFVGILGFAIAFFVGYGASTDAYKDFHSSFITLLDVLMGASDIGGLVASEGPSSARGRRRRAGVSSA